MNTEDNFTEMCMMVVSDAIDDLMFVLSFEFTVVTPCPLSETHVNWPDILPGTRYSPNIQDLNSKIILPTLLLLNSELVTIKSRLFTYFNPVHIESSALTD